MGEGARSGDIAGNSGGFAVEVYGSRACLCRRSTLSVSRKSVLGGETGEF